VSELHAFGIHPMLHQQELDTTTPGTRAGFFATTIIQ
jgi:hypothetical protein